MSKRKNKILFAERFNSSIFFIVKDSVLQKKPSFSWSWMTNEYQFIRNFRAKNNNLPNYLLKLTLKTFFLKDFVSCRMPCFWNFWSKRHFLYSKAHNKNGNLRAYCALFQLLRTKKGVGLLKWLHPDKEKIRQKRLFSFKFYIYSEQKWERCLKSYKQNPHKLVHSRQKMTSIWSWIKFFSFFQPM